MRIKQFIFILALTFFTGVKSNLKSQTLSNTNSLSQSEIELVTKYISPFPNRTQISIALIRNRNVIYFGIEKIDGKLFPVNNKDSVFDIGSITKVFTSTLLADLVMEKALRIDDPIETVLPYNLNQSLKEESHITFKTLANHTSGLPEMPDNYVPEYNTYLLRDYLQNKLTLGSIPGEIYHYSNLGIGLLGYLMEIKTGKSYEDLLQEKIFRRFDMNFSTTIFKKVQKYVILGLDPSGKVVKNWQPNVLHASTGILSNTSDLSKFILANFSNDSILSFQKQITFTDDYLDLALGWKVFKYAGNTVRWYQHDGATDGYRSSIMMDINANCAIIILSNVSSAHPNNGNIDKLCWNLLKQEYILETINESTSVGAPFLEIALAKGWGSHLNDSIQFMSKTGNSIIGVWQKQSAGRTISRTFMPNNKVQSDFYQDPEIDVWGYYYLNGNQVQIQDIGGDACNTNGLYSYYIHGDTLNFNIIDDNCDGRKTGLSGIWIRKIKNQNCRQHGRYNQWALSHFLLLILLPRQICNGLYRASAHNQLCNRG